MPTADRRPFVSRAVHYFLRQDYPAAELIVLDDGDAAAADLLPADPRIRYERLPQRAVLGTKRNLACEMARGDLILHWDDDDWSAPDRITRQAGVLTAAPGVEVCGLAALLFYDAVARQGWRYRYRLAGRAWVAGNTMCYRRGVWKRMPFAAVPEGEDTRFVWALEPRQVRALPEPDFFVGILHQRNTSSRRRRDPAWSSVDVEEIRRIMGADLATYEGWDAGDQLSRSSQPHM
jgi:glycosyltransferase involved in cell wall biosynthesis